MKLLRFDHGATGVLLQDSEESRILDVAAAAQIARRLTLRGADVVLAAFGTDGNADWGVAITFWDSVRAALDVLIENAVAGGSVKSAVRPLDDIHLQPPLPNRSSQIFAMGGNFAEHASRGLTVVTGRAVTEAELSSEKERGLPPWGFLVLPSVLATSGDPITPPLSVTRFDYEAEVAVILAEGGRNIPVDRVRVWGVTAFNDFSIRDPQLKIGVAVDRGVFSFPLQKNFDSGKSMGPWVVVDPVLDYRNLRFKCTVNGEIRQDAATSQMMYSFADLVAHVSQYVTMVPGDIIVSGTAAGTAIESGADGSYLLDGDLVETEVEGIGVLRNRISLG